MALGQTNISTSVIRSALSEDNNNVFRLCTSSKINKWSRFKPVRGTWPQSSNGKYGLDLTNNWAYLKPQGGSPGGTPDEPGRMGDFRGYEHDQNIAGPVIWMLSDPELPHSTLKPSLVPYIGSWVFQMNTVSGNVRILPSDIGIQNYYWGIRLVTPQGQSYYKTTGSPLANGASISIDVRINTPDPATFNNCPYGIGTFNWQAFICLTSQTSWATSAPSVIIYLPTGTFGSKVCINSGTINVTDWLYLSDNQHSWAWYDGTYTDFLETIIYTNAGVTRWYITDSVAHPFPSWMSYKVYDSLGAFEITNNPLAWDSGCRLRLFPTNPQVPNSPERTADIYLNIGGEDLGSISVVHEEAPEERPVTISKWPGDTSGLVLSNTSGYVYVGETLIHLTFTPTGAGSTTLYYKIIVRQNDAGLGSISGCINGQPKTTTVNAVDPIESGDLVAVQLSGDLIT